MIGIKLNDGFEIQVDEETLDDYELLEDLARIDGAEENVPMDAIISATTRLIGEEQYKALKEHLRSESGRVPASKMLEAIQQVLLELNENPESKN